MKTSSAILIGMLVLAIGDLQADQMNLRTYDTGVRLAQTGQTTCAIIFPGSEDTWAVSANRIADTIGNLTGSRPPVIADTDAVRSRLSPISQSLRNRNLILLGNLNNNRAIFPFYANYYCYCDARYPGHSGFVLRTIVRPFGREANVLLVGGNTPEDVEIGVTELIMRINKLAPAADITLPYMLDVRFGDEMSNLFAPLLDPKQEAGHQRYSDEKGRYARALDTFTRNAHLFFYTGKAVFAWRAREAALLLAEYDDACIRIGDYTMENLAMAWRRVSPSPAFQPEDQHSIDTLLLGTIRKQERSWWRVSDASSGIGGRHHTTGMLAWWTLIRTLLEMGEPDDTTRQQLTQWRSECEAYLDGLTRHYWDDLDDYQSADSVQNTASYCLQTGQLDWFSNGTARKAAQKLLSITDNLGCYAGIQGYGEALPGWERFTLSGGLLLGSCGFVYEDPGFQWILHHFPSLERSWGALQPWGLHQYATGTSIASKPPDWLTGLQVVRFTPYRWAFATEGRFLNNPLMDGFSVGGVNPATTPAEQAYDKAVLRAGASSCDMYALLQGHSATALSTIDVNAIIRYTDLGKLWLVQNTARRSLFFKNAVYLSRTSSQEAIPASAELVACATDKDAMLVSSRLNDYRGTTWTRHMIAPANRFIVVIDQLRAQEAGSYIACCTWRTPGTAALDESGWQAWQGDTTFRIVPGQMDNLSSRREREHDGATRPTMLRQNRRWKAECGDELFFENLLYTSDPSRPQSYRTRWVAPGAILIRPQNANNPESLCLAAANDLGIRIEDLNTSAKVLLLTAHAAYVAGGSGLSLDDESIAADAGQIELNEDQSQKAVALMNRLWNKSAVPAAIETKGPGQPAQANVRRLWTHPGPSSKGDFIDGIRLKPVRNISGSDLLATDRILPSLRAEPRLLPQRGTGLTFANAATAPDQKTDSNRWQDTAEIVLHPLKQAEFILELPSPQPVEEIELIGDTVGETSTPLPPATIEVETTLSSDGFAKDCRVHRTVLRREPTWHNLYKGHSYVFECYRQHLSETSASAIRIRFVNGPSEQMLLTDVRVRAASVPEDQPVEWCGVDLENDGQNEILAWTSEGDLAVIDSGGDERWRKSWPSGIISVGAWDLDDDGRREILVSRTDRHVDAIESDGTPRWDSDVSGLHVQTDERFFGDGSVIFGMAVYPGSESAPPKVLFTGYFYSAWFDSNGRLKKCFRRSGHFTQIREIPQGLGQSGGLVMRSDIPWVGPACLEWWITRNQKPDVVCDVLNGPAVFFELVDLDHDRKAEALIATREGIGVYAPDKPRTRWQHMTGAPPTGVGVITTGSEQNQTAIAYGREDGCLFVLDSEGKVQEQTHLAAPIRCLTVLRTRDHGPVVIAGTDTALHCLQLPGLTERWRQPGAYQRLEPCGSADHPDILAARRGGQIERLRISPD